MCDSEHNRILKCFEYLDNIENDSIELSDVELSKYGFKDGNDFINIGTIKNLIDERIPNYTNKDEHIKQRKAILLSYRKHYQDLIAEVEQLQDRKE